MDEPNTLRVAVMIDNQEPQQNVLRFLAAHPDINPNYVFEDRDSSMVMVSSIRYRDLKISTKLIEMGAIPPKDDIKYMDWLEFGARNSIPFIDLLIAKNIISASELFPHIAAWPSGKIIPIMDHLTSKPGFDINYKDEKGNTAIMILINNNLGDDEIRGEFIKRLRLLIQWGADPTIQNNIRESAISLAYGDRKVLDILRNRPSAAAVAHAVPQAPAVQVDPQTELLNELNKPEPNLAKVRELVPIVGVNKLINHETLLSMMLRTTKTGVVEALLDLGADPYKIIGHYVKFPCYYEINYVNHTKKLDMLKLMITKGLDLNVSIGGHYKNQFIFEAIAEQIINSRGSLDDFLSYVIDNSKGIINTLSNPGHRISFSQGQYTPLSYSCSTVSNNSHLSLIKKLLESGANPNIINSDGTTAFSIAIHKSPISLIPMTAAVASALFLKILEYLLEHGMDPNLKDRYRYNLAKNGLRPIGVAFLFNEQKAIDLLLHKGADINASDLIFSIATITTKEPKRLDSFKNFLNLPGLVIDEKTIEAAADKKFHHEINELILAKANRKGSMWKGWTRSDAEKFDILFTEEGAKNYSCCPVCLKYTIRQDGCLYMHHKCSALQGFYHKKLYNKYKDGDGEIEWCTVCGRICKNHRHYAVDNAQNPVPAFAVPEPRNMRVFFQNDCRGANGGGGLPEKIERIRALRQFAKELQEVVGEIPQTEALEQLVEAMWNAPAASFYGRRAEKIITTKKWNFETANAFPPNVPPSQAANKNILAPNIQRPNANKDLLPTFKADGSNNIAMNNSVPVVYFHHRLPDGTVKNHEEGIGLPTLVGFITDINAKFGTEEFGACPFQCGARLHPDEVKKAFELLGAEEANAALIADYRTKFNRKFRA